MDWQDVKFPTCKLCGAELKLFRASTCKVKGLYCPVCHNIQEMEEEEWILN